MFEEGTFTEIIYDYRAKPLVEMNFPDAEIQTLYSQGTLVKRLAVTLPIEQVEAFYEYMSRSGWLMACNHLVHMAELDHIEMNNRVRNWFRNLIPYES